MEKFIYFFGIIISAAASYLVGSISPAYFLGRRKGFDIRQRGTFNAGATNAAKTLGMRSGIIVMLIDVMKAFVCVWVVRIIYKSIGMGIIAGLFCTVGHIFSIFLNFHGGKGTACLAGIVLALTPELVLPMVFGLALVGFAFDYASIMPLMAAGIYPLLFYGQTSLLNESLLLALLLPLLLWSHRGNFEKHKTGEEGSFRSFIKNHGFDKENCTAFR